MNGLDNFIRAHKTISSSRYLLDIFKHVRKVENLELMVLKGHLVVENLLDSTLSKLFYNPLKEDLTFVKKLAICEALGLFNDTPETLDRIRTLNRIRNKMAHDLSFKTSMLSVLFSGCPEQVKMHEEIKDENSRLLITLEAILEDICLSLNASLMIRIAVNNALLDQKEVSVMKVLDRLRQIHLQDSEVLLKELRARNGYDERGSKK